MLSTQAEGKNDDLLVSWKDIAAYLKCSVRKAQRLERRELPVKRIAGTKSVWASKAESRVCFPLLGLLQYEPSVVMDVGLRWSHSRVKIQPEFRYTRHRPQTQPDPRTPHLLVPALHKKSWAVIDRPYSLGCATVGALYERP